MLISTFKSLLFWILKLTNIIEIVEFLLFSYIDIKSKNTWIKQAYIQSFIKIKCPNLSTDMWKCKVNICMITNFLITVLVSLGHFEVIYYKKNLGVSNWDIFAFLDSVGVEFAFMQLKMTGCSRVWQTLG